MGTLLIHTLYAVVGLQFTDPDQRTSGFVRNQYDDISEIRVRIISSAFTSPESISSSEVFWLINWSLIFLEMQDILILWCHLHVTRDICLRHLNDDTTFNASQRNWQNPKLSQDSTELRHRFAYIRRQCFHQPYMIKATGETAHRKPVRQPAKIGAVPLSGVGLQQTTSE